MINKGSIIDKVKLNGGLSEELTSSDFFGFYTGQAAVGGYLGAKDRNDFRDRAMETYLKAKGCKENGSALLMSSKISDKMMQKVNADTSPKEFVELMRKTLDMPLKTVWEVLYKAGIRPLSPIGNVIKPINIEEVEEGVRLYIRQKNGKVTIKPKSPTGARQAFEGRYEFVEGSSNKFWEIYVNERYLFTARWGRIERGVQDSKDDYTLEEAQKVVRTKLNKGYRKVS